MKLSVWQRFEDEGYDYLADLEAMEKNIEDAQGKLCRERKDIEEKIMVLDSLLDEIAEIQKSIYDLTDESIETLFIGKSDE